MFSLIGIIILILQYPSMIECSWVTKSDHSYWPQLWPVLDPDPNPYCLVTWPSTKRLRARCVHYRAWNQLGPCGPHSLNEVSLDRVQLLVIKIVQWLEFGLRPAYRLHLTSIAQQFSQRWPMSTWSILYRGVEVLDCLWTIVNTPLAWIG